jgi:fermentation-respiration switch protein FrsA (DUF1100 family)
MARRRVLKVLAYLALAYVALVIAARLSARRFIFPAPRVARIRTPAGAALVTFAAADGVSVHAMHFPAPREGARTVILFHGNAETIASSYERAQALTRAGLGALVVEYRGYGTSEGAPTEQGLYADAEAAFSWLAARGARDVAVWGTSLGTGVAVEMARRHEVAGLVLVTPYTSMVDAVKAHAPFLPAGIVVVDRFDNRAKCAEVRAPTLVVHGDKDEIVPYWMGEAVTRATPGARLVTVPGAGHNDLFAVEPSLYGTIAEHLAR